jgi:hypothetical protein
MGQDLFGAWIRFQDCLAFGFSLSLGLLRLGYRRDIIVVFLPGKRVAEKRSGYYRGPLHARADSRFGSGRFLITPFAVLLPGGERVRLPLAKTKPLIAACAMHTVWFYFTTSRMRFEDLDALSFGPAH